MNINIANFIAHLKQTNMLAEQFEFSRSQCKILRHIAKIAKKIQKGKSDRHIMRTCFVSQNELNTIKEYMREKGVL